jgi:hypothetical protein
VCAEVGGLTEWVMISGSLLDDRDNVIDLARAHSCCIHIRVHDVLIEGRECLTVHRGRITCCLVVLLGVVVLEGGIVPGGTLETISEVLEDGITRVGSQWGGETTVFSWVGCGTLETISEVLEDDVTRAGSQWGGETTVFSCVGCVKLTS